MKKNKIAVIGIRGIPATYGGIEKHCEMIYPLFVEMGFEVVVYARDYYCDNQEKSFKGINIKTISVPNIKGLETFIHSFIATILAIFSDASILHFHAQGPTLFSFLPKILSPKKTVCFTCHGIDKDRDKWGKIAKFIITLGEIASAKFPDHKIGVSEHLVAYYRDKYSVLVNKIYNGVDVKEPLELNNALKFNISKGNYFIFVGRLVPEKAIDVLIKAFKTSLTEKRLVIVGGSAGTDQYVEELKNLAIDDPRIIFTSYAYGDDLRELYSNAFAYISASKLEGQPITLLEAMSYSLPVILSDIAPHSEIIDISPGIGCTFKTNDLEECKQAIDKLDQLDDNSIEKMKSASKNLVLEKFNWDNIAIQTIELFKSLKDKK